MLLLLPLAVAFEPQDHRAMAERAVALELGAAFATTAPAAVLPTGAPAASTAATTAPTTATLAARWLPRGAANEDWNLPRKWTRWHHYDPPGFEVHPLGRRTSAERVATLDDELRAAAAAGDEAEAWLLAGLAAHHLQDMASPLHVVPVAHGLGDPFEGYPFAPLIAEAGSPATPVPSGSPPEVQRTLALATLTALETPLPCPSGPVPWSRVWVPGDRSFGRYGDVPFGGVPGCEAATEAFARARVEDAVAATRSVVRYVLALLANLPESQAVYER